MVRRHIKKLLEQALLHDGAMDRALYKAELEEGIPELKASMRRDREDYIFSLTVTDGKMAMVLVKKTGEVYINEEARETLKALWPAAYESNMRRFIPSFSRELYNNQMPLMGVTTVA